MLRVTGASNCPQELVVAGDSPTVFGWAVALASETHRPVHPGLGGLDRLNHHLVFPVVAEIIAIHEPRVLVGCDVVQAHPMLRKDSAHWGFGVRYAVTSPPDNKLVQVALYPSHRSLQHSMKAVKRQSAGDRELQMGGSMPRRVILSR
jgi:hypothetical protein